MSGNAAGLLETKWARKCFHLKVWQHEGRVLSEKDENLITLRFPKARPMNRGHTQCPETRELNPGPFVSHCSGDNRLFARFIRMSSGIYISVIIRGFIACSLRKASFRGRI